MSMTHDPESNGPMHLEICFLQDGDVNFYPEGGDRDELAARLAGVVRLLSERPELVRCAAGACAGDCGHGDGTVRVQ